MKPAKQTPLQECESAMARLKSTFNTGNNRFGSYGQNVKESYARWAMQYQKLTGKEAPSIYRDI